MANEKTPITKVQKGRRWATATLVLTGLFSIWFNVRSGKIAAEPILFSAMPVVVLFLTIHLISYLNPRKGMHKVLVYFGLGMVSIVAFGMSGFHLYTEAIKNGQIWIIAITYPFIVDVPSVISAVILVEKVPVARAVTQPANPAKKTVPAKKASPTKATATPTKRTSSPKATIPVKPEVTFRTPDILTDPLEREFLSA